MIVGKEGTGYKSPDQNTTMINITAGRKLVHLPLIAAGGIADGYGFAGALSMGASGIYMGTGFIATKEFPISDNMKQKILNQKITDSDFIQKVLNLKHGSVHSFSAGVIESIPTVKEFIDKIISEAEEVMNRFKKWQMV